MASRDTTPRLRFDKVATRVIQRLRDAADEAVPDGTTVVVTITAPIRVPAKTAAALEDKIHTLVASNTPRRDVNAMVFGNRVRIRMIRHDSARAPKLIGFVHTADTAALSLLNRTHASLTR